MELTQDTMPENLSYIQTLLVELLKTPSPTGDTQTILKRLTDEATALGYQTRRGRKGALLITVPGKDDAHRRLLTAHVDTLGAMVKEILPSGCLRLTQVGGYAWNAIEGEYCIVKTAAGHEITGTILLHNTSVHINREVSTAERTSENIEVILDARVSSKAETEALGVQVGDFVYFDPRTTVTSGGFIKSRHLDDKASVAILFGLLKQLKDEQITLPHTLELLISNNEEIGFGGNSNIPETVVEYLAVDMGAIGDGQSTDEYCVSICAKDGSGPYHLGLRRHLTALADQLGLHYAIDIYPFYSSDASAAVRAGADVIHGLIGPGVANSHAYERTHLAAIDNTLKLLHAYVQSPLVG